MVNTVVLKAAAAGASQQQILLHLIDDKYTVLNAIINASMLWWVSMVVFLITLMLGAFRVIEKLPRIEKRDQDWIYWSATGALFLCAVYMPIAFIAVSGLQNDVGALLGAVGLKPDLIRTNEFSWVWWALVLGEVTFGAFISIWLALRSALKQSLERRAREIEKGEGGSI